jgi:hypothetical protein
MTCHRAVAQRPYACVNWFNYSIELNKFIGQGDWTPITTTTVSLIDTSAAGYFVDALSSFDTI